jgi:hypothetical protein
VDLPWMWRWFNCSRHLIWGDYSNKGASCPISHWWELCGTLNQFTYFGFEQIILGYAHWRYAIVLVCPFSTQSKKGARICEPCKYTKNKGLEIASKYNSLDINAEPFETCGRRVQMTCCEDAHRCTKKQACLGKSGFICVI